MPPRKQDEAPTITLGDFQPDVEAGLASLTEYSLVRYSAMFETFAQCWALNYLLAKLETGQTWSASERKLASTLSPLRNSESLPTLLHIVQAIPLLDGLGSLSHVDVAALTDEIVEAPLHPLLNALQTIKFWRAYRNLVVHSSGLVSRAFVARHGAFHEVFRQFLPSIQPLAVGRPLRHNDATVMTVASTHYKAARWMNDELVKIAGDRRGHPFAPNPQVEKVWFPWPPPPAPPLLLAGDHSDSLRWVADGAFRSRMLTAAGKPLVAARRAAAQQSDEAGEARDG